MALENAGIIPRGEILIVEDNAVNLKTLLQIIARAGYLVRHAAGRGQGACRDSRKTPRPRASGHFNSRRKRH